MHAVGLCKGHVWKQRISEYRLNEVSNKQFVLEIRTRVRFLTRTYTHIASEAICMFQNLHLLMSNGNRSTISSPCLRLHSISQSDLEDVTLEVTTILSSRFTSPDPRRISAIVRKTARDIGEELRIRDRS